MVVVVEQFRILYLHAYLKYVFYSHSMKESITEKEYAAVVILRETGVNSLEAALLIKEALKICRGSISRVRKSLQLGCEALRKREKTVTFRKAVEAALEARRGRRPRTQSDFRYLCRRLMKRCSGLPERRVRSINTTECKRWLEEACTTPSQRQKGRAILSGVFSTAQKNGWCDANPVAQVETPRIHEKTVPILKPEEIDALLKASREYQGGACMAAVGMMLYAGIRPHEVARLTWAQVDLAENSLYILPRHSKTGGARRVTIHKPLQHILNQHRKDNSEKICPRNWLHHWRALRRAAGWDSAGHQWPQDVLRHTFASYHLSHFRSYTLLQCEIGHRDAGLLRTRYIDQRGVVHAAQFWEAA